MNLILAVLLLGGLVKAQKGELVLISTESGVVHAIDSLTGNATWHIDTGSPLVSIQSNLSKVPLQCTSEGVLYFIDSNDQFTKLEHSLQDLVGMSPIRIPELPNVLLLGFKTFKVFRINANNGEFSLEDADSHTCPHVNDPFPNSFLIGKMDYSIVGIDDTTAKELWNITVSQFVSFNSENNSLEKRQLALEANLEAPISSVHRISKGSAISEKLNYPSEETEPSKGLFDLKVGALGLLVTTTVAIYVGFKIGKKKSQETKSFPEESFLSEDSIIEESSFSDHFEFERKDTAIVPYNPETSQKSCMEKFFSHDKEIYYDNSYVTHKLRLNKSLEEALLIKEEVSTKSLKITPELHELCKKYIPPNDDNKSVVEFYLDECKETPMLESSDKFEEIIEYLDDGHYEKKFEYRGYLGRGGFSQVHLARHKLDDQLYAIKIVRMKVTAKQMIYQHKLFREVTTIKKLYSKYVVRYITCWAERETEKQLALEYSNEEYSEDCSESDSCFDSQLSLNILNEYMNVLLYIQMEYCEGMTLKDWLEQRDRQVNRKANFHLFTQMLKGVKHIHENGIIHRDLKPSNIFIDKDNNVKIGDFNLATMMDEKLDKSLQRHSMNIGTPLYLAPEQANSRTYNQKVDIFPLGCILLELCCKFDTQHEKFISVKDLREHQVLPEGLTSEFPLESQLILQMTSPNSDERPTAQSLLKSDILEKWSSQVN